MHAARPVNGQSDHVLAVIGRGMWASSCDAAITKTLIYDFVITLATAVLSITGHVSFLSMISSLLQNVPGSQNRTAVELVEHVELTLEAAGLVGTRQPHVGYSQRSSSAWRLQIARQHGGKYGDVHELPLD